MREMLCADDCVALYGDDDDNDRVIVEPSFIAFTPAGADMRCVCGQPMRSWSRRQVAVNRLELECTRCCRVHGALRLGTQIRR